MATRWRLYGVGRLLPLLLAACAGPPAPPVDPPAPHPHHWLDDDGRAVVYRGVNVNQAAKHSPDHGHGLSDDALALLPAHGVTLVRLLVFWHAIEPVDGVFDDAYLDRVRADLDALHALDVDVVLDLHQDVYGEGFGHTGMPRWTCDEARYAAFDPPDGAWFSAYTDPAVRACFDAFWGSADLQDRYAEMAAHLVGTLHHPAVVGLDVMNEPFWGNLDVETHDREVLPAFYARVVDAVRAVDPDLRQLLAPSVAANLDADPSLDLSGLDDPHLGVAPHFYPAYAELGTGYDGDFSDEADALGRLAAHARDQGVPLFLGEYGIFSERGNEGDFVRAVLEAVESVGGSTASWSYDRGRLLDDDEGPGPLLTALSGPYAHRIPGRVDAFGDEVAFTLHGAGTLVWIDPSGGCEIDVQGAEVVSVERVGVRIRVGLRADGAVRARARCPG